MFLYPQSEILNRAKFVHFKNKPGRGLTVGERLQPTLETAIVEKDKCAANARWTGLALNAAIGLQVLFGSLTTGLSALSVSGGISVNTF